MLKSLASLVNLRARLFINLPSDHFVSALCRDLNVVINEQRNGLCRRTLQTLHEEDSHWIDVQEFGRSGRRGSDQRKRRVSRNLGNDLAKYTQAAVMHLLRCLTFVDVGIRLERIPRVAPSGSIP